MGLPHLGIARFGDATLVIQTQIVAQAVAKSKAALEEAIFFAVDALDHWAIQQPNPGQAARGGQ
jgi:hypothetical protein